MNREIQQVAGAGELHPAEPDQVRGEKRRDGAKRERADDAVAQRLLLILLRQPQHQHGQHHRVVGAEKPLEHDEERDRDEIRRLNIREERNEGHALPV